MNAAVSYICILRKPDTFRGEGRVVARTHAAVTFLLLLVAAASFTGCGGGNGSTNVTPQGQCGTPCGSSGMGSSGGVITGISPTTLPSASAGTFYSQTFQASGGIGPYSWTTSPVFTQTPPQKPAFSPPPNLTMDMSNGVYSGTPNANGAGGYFFVIQVSDSERPTPAAFSAVVTLMIHLAPPLSIVTEFLPSATVSLPYHTVLQASGGVPPYSWSLTSGALPQGFSLASDGSITGIPTTTTTNSSFTVQVQDSQSPPYTVTTNFGIGVFASQNSLLKGSYAFLVSGYITPGAPQSPIAWAGSLVADGNGNLSGVIDSAGSSPSVSAQSVTGTYIVGEDDRGTLTINTNGAGISALTFDISVGSNPHGVAQEAALVETDAAKGSGFMEQQDTSSFSTSAMTGNYTFGMKGKYLLGGVETFTAAVGSFAANGGTIASGLTDSVDNGSIVANNSVLSGGYSVGASGRGQITLNGIEPSPISATFYAVSAIKWLVLATSASTAAGSPTIVWTGTVFHQSGNPFGASSLNATSVFEQDSATASGSSVSVGLITFNNGNANLTADENDAGTISTPTTSFAYSITSGSNGRLTATAMPSSSPIIGYLIAPNECFLLTEDQFGDLAFIEPQSGGPFGNLPSSLNTYSFFGTMPLGTEVHNASGSTTGAASLQSGIFAALDPVHLVCAGNVFLSTDTESVVENASAGGLTDSVETTSSCELYTVATNGRVTTKSGLEVMYIVSPTKAVSISLENGNPNPTMRLVQE
jgi:hypothetical protein